MSVGNGRLVGRTQNLASFYIPSSFPSHGWDCLFANQGQHLRGSSSGNMWVQFFCEILVEAAAPRVMVSLALVLGPCCASPVPWFYFPNWSTL